MGRARFAPKCEMCKPVVGRSGIKHTSHASPPILTAKEKDAASTARRLFPNQPIPNANFSQQPP